MDDGTAVVANWSTLRECYNASKLEFCDLIEANVQKRQAPDMRFSRKDLGEGHISFLHREHLLAVISKEVVHRS